MYITVVYSCGTVLTRKIANYSLILFMFCERALSFLLPRHAVLMSLRCRLHADCGRSGRHLWSRSYHRHWRRSFRQVS